MNLVFTICSNNYLAQAKTLIDSIHIYHPEFKIVIGLVDQLTPDIDYSFFNPAVVVPVNQIGLENLPELCNKYNIVELNTAVKASYFKHLRAQYKCDNIIYFDPDIKVFSPLSDILARLESCDILLTPHIHTPIPHDGLKPQENNFLNYGIYNLGFVALNMVSTNVLNFLNWWEERTLNLGFNRVSEGLFVDQLWINLVPLLFEKVDILKEYGYNMAPWNLHERSITASNPLGYLLNDCSVLVFYHFSSYNYKSPLVLCREYYDRFSLKDRPDLNELYQSYDKDLIANKVEIFSKENCRLLAPSYKLSQPMKSTKPGMAKSILKEIIPPFFFKLKKQI